MVDYNKLGHPLRSSLLYLQFSQIYLDILNEIDYKDLWLKKLRYPWSIRVLDQNVFLTEDSRNLPEIIYCF